MTANIALLLIDVQNDFCPGGALPVANGDAVVTPLNRLVALFAEHGLPIFASRDWHPRQTSHFASFGGLWPDHCVQGTAGAEFHPELHLPESVVILSKGQGSDEDGYSDFEASNDQQRMFIDLLRDRGIEHLCVGGLATDYCVKATVLDALAEGLSVTVIEEAIAGVNVVEGDAAEAMREMVQAGAKFVSSTDDLLVRLGL